MFEDLFRKYYNIDTNKKINYADVIYHRHRRFEEQKYWQIWKKYGFNIGFIEGIFHVMNGQNVLDKIGDKEIEIFQYPKLFFKYFKSPDDVSCFLRQKHQLFIANQGSKLEASGLIRRINQNSHNCFAAYKKLEQDYNGDAFNLTKGSLFKNINQFKGYGRKITNMVMNLVFDKAEIAIDTRVFQASISLGLISPNKYQLQNDKHKAEIEQIIKDKAGIFAIDADYLLFQEGGKKY